MAYWNVDEMESPELVYTLLVCSVDIIDCWRCIMTSWHAALPIHFHVPWMANFCFKRAGGRSSPRPAAGANSIEQYPQCPTHPSALNGRALGERIRTSSRTWGTRESCPLRLVDIETDVHFSADIRSSLVMKTVRMGRDPSQWYRSRGTVKFNQDRPTPRLSLLLIVIGRTINRCLAVDTW